MTKSVLKLLKQARGNGLNLSLERHIPTSNQATQTSRLKKIDSQLWESGVFHSSVWTDRPFVDWKPHLAHDHEHQPGKFPRNIMCIAAQNRSESVLLGLLKEALMIGNQQDRGVLLVSGSHPERNHLTSIDTIKMIKKLSVEIDKPCVIAAAANPHLDGALDDARRKLDAGADLLLTQPTLGDDEVFERWFEKVQGNVSLGISIIDSLSLYHVWKELVYKSDYSGTLAVQQIERQWDSDSVWTRQWNVHQVSCAVGMQSRFSSIIGFHFMPITLSSKHLLLRMLESA
jgi:5,10-methylenetetrahydrofolate reductase